MKYSFNKEIYFEMYIWKKRHHTQTDCFPSAGDGAVETITENDTGLR